MADDNVIGVPRELKALSDELAAMECLAVRRATVGTALAFAIKFGEEHGGCPVRLDIETGQGLHVVIKVFADGKVVETFVEPVAHELERKE